MPQSPLIVGYGLSQALPNIFPSPIVAKRAPTTSDIKYQIGQVWVEPVNTAGVAQNAAWILVSIINNSATWLSIQAGGGSGPGSFTTLTSTGATTLATTGASTNTFGNTTGATSLALSVGTGGFTLNGVGASNYTIGAATTTGTISIGGTAQTGTMEFGNSSGTVAVQIGNGTGANNVTIGAAGTGLVSIGNATGGVSLTGTTIVDGTLSADTLYATADNGGIAATNALSDASVAVAGGSGAFTLTSTTGAGTATNAGYIKMYVGVTPVFVPYFTTTT